jgi:hypothetical protein
VIAYDDDDDDDDDDNDDFHLVQELGTSVSVVTRLQAFVLSGVMVIVLAIGLKISGFTPG